MQGPPVYLLIALLLVSHDAANEQVCQPCKSICPWKEDCVFGPGCPSVEKFDPTLVVQSNLSSTGGLISLSGTFIPRFVIHWQPPNRYPIVGLKLPLNYLSEKIFTPRDVFASDEVKVHLGLTGPSAGKGFLG
jgi:hypothetical protein